MYSIFKKRNLLWAALITVILVITFFLIKDSVSSEKEEMPKAKNGVLDLSSWDWEEDGNVKLDGNWDFYWKQLLSYKDFQKNEAGQPIPADVPNVWNGYIVNGESLPGEGYATYKLHVKGKPQEEGLLGIRIYPLATSYTLWVNDKKIASNGNVASSPEKSVSEFKPVTAFFQPPAQDFDIIVQISNYEYARGGLWYSIYLGSDKSILKLQNELNGKEVFLTGALLIIGLYSLCIFILRRESKISLYFSILCFLIIIVEDVLGQFFIVSIFPGMSFDTFNRIWDLSILWAPFFLIMFINEVFPTRFSRTAFILFGSLTVILSLVHALMPISFTSQDVLILNLLPIFEIAYTIFVAIIAAWKKAEGSLLYLGGMTIGIISVIHDVLFLNNVIRSNYGELMFIGVFALVFAQILLQAKRFSASYKVKELMLEKMDALDKLKDEFLANTSHELRTPLNAIIAIADGMVRGSEGEVSEKQRNSLSVISASGRRLSNLVNDILDYSRIKHGDITLNLTSVSIKAVVENTLGVIRYLSITETLEFYIEIPDALPKVLADENRLIQIFYNLIGNAVKFTVHGYVKITVRDLGEKVEVSVEDTGQGIPPDKLEDIFKSFEQVDSSLTRRREGTGLGLAITKHLVELHQGKIRAESEPDKGSKFIFTIPAFKGNFENSPGYRVRNEIAAAKEAFDEMPFRLPNDGPHILIVDDNKANLKSAMSILKMDGYAITAVAEGNAVLDVIKNDVTISLVILDVMMPEISGYEVCRKIREHKSLFDLPVLMLTAKTATPDIVMGFQAGANDYLHKPFEAEELLARVRTLVELKKSADKAIKAELKFLQSQIRPHFIHNALNTIVSISRRDPERARKLLVEFSHYLRNCFDFKDLQDAVPFERELNFVRSYVTIEQARFGEKLKVLWDIDELSFTVPPLILQPLVENAIIHGLRTKPQGGSIVVYVRQKPDKIRIGVKDDGSGMPPDRLAEMLDDNKSERGVGIININQRLRNLYGVSLIIESVQGEGTDIYMEIPIQGVTQDD